MHTINYNVRLQLGLHSKGRPTVPITFIQKNGTNWKMHNVDSLLCDTGAVVTSLNKAVAEENNYPIIKCVSL